MLRLNTVHHIAIICSDYKKSKEFYTQILGLTILREEFRAERASYKLDLALNGVYIIELFSFPFPPIRNSQPEACGLRHLAFSVDNIIETQLYLKEKQISTEKIRIDSATHKKFLFIQDPDNLPIEFYES